MMIKLYENLPLIIFGLIFLISSILLIIGIILSASAKDTIKLAKGKQMLMKAVYSFSSLLLIVIVFSSITWFLNKNIDNKPEVDLDGYPASPVDPNFPSPPKFIKISDTYFNGPYPFQNYAQVSRSAIFSILCKNEDEYDIIDIDSAMAQTDLTQHINFACWSSFCGNLNIGMFWIPSIKDNSWNERDVLEFLKNENNLLCPIEQ
ncbi:hypothetical protein KKA24_03640 [Patescibacteria group bacterium]|nr:hypothetical protein [Patescibacteria group bacterium]